MRRGAYKEDIASQAQLYYSIGTAYGDIARLENTNDENYIEKQLFYFQLDCRSDIYILVKCVLLMI